MLFRSLLESAAEVHGHAQLLAATLQPVLPNGCAGHAMPPVKKTRGPLSFPSAVTPAPASAMAVALENGLEGEQEIPIRVMGGQLYIRFHKTGDKFTDVRLIGPAKFVFKGEVSSFFP